MENKSKRVPLSKVEEYTKQQASFGWSLASQEDLKPNNTVVLNFQREPKEIEDYKATKKLEKQYNAVNSSAPLLSIIFAGVGALFLLAFFFLKPYVFFYISFLYISLTSFFIALFSLIIFILLKIKKKEILSYLLSEAALRSGVSDEFPTKHNIQEEGEETWALTHTFKK